MTYSEVVMTELMRLVEEKQYSLLEAAAEYCETRELDEAEFVAGLDTHIIDQIKLSAVEQRAIRRCVQAPVPTLF